MADTLPMSPRDAWLYAASWGSYMRAGDPGACMYGFDARFHLKSEAHRAACLDHIAGCRRIVEGHPPGYAPDELDQMAAFEAALRAAPIAEGRAS